MLFVGRDVYGGKEFLRRAATAGLLSDLKGCNNSERENLQQDCNKIATIAIFLTGDVDMKNEIKPGVELDSLIAEKIMGIKVNDPFPNDAFEVLYKKHLDKGV